MPSVQTRRKRKLGQFLHSLRKRAGKTEEDFENLTRKSQATLSRIESGHSLPGWNVLGAMLTFYEASEGERREAEDMWTDANQDSKRVAHPTVYNPKGRAFARTEVDANSSRTIESLGIPGLLQTPEYTATTWKSSHQFHNPAVDEGRVLAARASRAKILHGPDALELHALLDEAVIHREVGGPQVMAAQLRHLLTLAEMPNVTIQVIPFSAGSYGTMSGGGSTILGFADEQDPDAVYLEYPGGGEWVENEEDVQKFVASFRDVASEAALSPAASAELIGRQATYLEDR
ncbi:helix-turn-helix domain-containing protein [Amycolatopsis cihanbeyliensis]|uniref:Helix-turn-helix protein n=1 Tax=Amycolatopsis cihanbeyliensis TaxID=1128664 RepID=A0A542DLZ9_AMYCI|nr:helix-turn-helix transcriptional regulator [Amycolatopsis cihanbeyliensis]TQJ04098.1 helix-turn-helix protein [Amycolatopsis cihanbeyliensis]